MKNPFAALFGAKKESSNAYRREMAKKLDGRAIKYVTERAVAATDAASVPGEASESLSYGTDDTVIGRSGALILKNDELLVYSSEKVIFRAKVEQLRASELMSLEGVILTAPDLENEGRVRTVIAYYTYYRKV